MFPRVLPKSLPQTKAFWHRGAPCSPRASRKFGLIHQGLSRSFRAGFTLVGAIPVPARPCEEASHAASRQVFLDAVAHGSVISWQHINLLGEYDFSDEKLRDSVGIRPPKLTP